MLSAMTDAERTQSIVCLDLEGVLVPEIWIAVAERTGIEALRRTTREEPDYDVLMRYRLDLLAEHGLTMSAIHDVIAGCRAAAGRRRVPGRAPARTQVVILSDTFEQFAAPLMAPARLAHHLCHRLVVERRPHHRLPPPHATTPSAGRCGAATA
jgi:phosphoserine/homoserine phosphotransferase